MVAGKRLALLALIIFTIGCDRVTKHLAERSLSDVPQQSLMRDTVRLSLSENTGGFLSLGATWPADVRTAVFVIGTGGCLVLLVISAVRGRWSGAPLWGVALYAAGGVSNLADRIYRGSVIDFLNVGIGPVRTGIFNVADMAIMLGVAMVLVGSWQARSQTAEPSSL